MANPTFTLDEVTKAANRAADSVLEAFGDDAAFDVDEALFDAVNLVVNATVTMLENPDVGLERVIAECYDSATGEILLAELDLDEVV